MPIRAKMLCTLLVFTFVAVSTSCDDSSTDASDDSSSIEISGTLGVEIYDQSINQIAVGRKCRMSPRFQPGTQIIAEDGAGKVLAVGTLSGGVAEQEIESGVTAGLAKYCTFDFSIADAPSSEFYELHVGDKTVYTASRSEVTDGDLELFMAPR